MYLEREVSTIGNSLFCPICDSHQPFLRNTFIFRAPSFLILQIKRFAVGSENMVCKDNRLVHCSPKLTITSSENKLVKYKLMAVIAHTGSCTSGHYTVQCFDEKSGLIFHCNDQHVSRTKIFNSNNAYVLFYVRVS